MLPFLPTGDFAPAAKKSLSFGETLNTTSLFKKFTTPANSPYINSIGFILQINTRYNVTNVKEYLVYQDTATTTYPTFEIWLEAGAIHVASRTNATTYAFHVFTNPIFLDVSKFFQLDVLVNLEVPTIAIRSCGITLPFAAGVVLPAQYAQIPFMSNLSDSGLIIGNEPTNTMPFHGWIQSVYSNSSGNSSIYSRLNGGVNFWTKEFVPHSYTQEVGRNGFYLDFRNTSSLATLGYDYSGKGNNFTALNFDLSKDIQDHSMQVTASVPDRTAIAAENLPVTGRNSVVSCTYIKTSYTGIPMTIAIPSSGIVYLEVEILAYNESTEHALGVFVSPEGQLFSSVNPFSTAGICGFGCRTADSGSGGASEFRFAKGDGTYVVGGTSRSFVPGDIIKIMVNASTSSIYVGLNGNWFNELLQESSTISNPTLNISAGVKFISINLLGALPSCRVNSGQNPFYYTPPNSTASGLTTNAMVASPVRAPRLKFTSILRTATQVQTNVQSLLFSDVILSKTLTSAVNSALFSLAANKTFPGLGTGRYTIPNSDSVLTNDSGSWISSTQQNQTGVSYYTIGTSTRVNNWNSGAPHTYIDYCWSLNAKFTTVSASSPVLAGYTYADDIAGMSASYWMGNGAGNAEVSTGQTAPVEFALIKQLEGSGKGYLWTKGMGNNSYINPSSKTALPVVNSNIIRADPTATTFKLGVTSTGLNEAGVPYNALFFRSIPGFMKIGEYTGRSAGVFNYTGFSVRFLLVQCLSGVGAPWSIYDISRITSTGKRPYILNTSDAETGNHTLFFTSLGFFVYSSGNSINSDGRRFQYLAIGYSDGKISNGVVQMANPN